MRLGPVSCANLPRKNDFPALSFGLAIGPEYKQPGEHHRIAKLRRGFPEDFGSAVAERLGEHRFRGPDCQIASRREKHMAVKRSGQSPFTSNSARSLLSRSAKFRGLACHAAASSVGSAASRALAVISRASSMGSRSRDMERA